MADKIIASACWKNEFFGPAEAITDPASLDINRHKLLILWGGEDISPSIYGETPMATSAPRDPSRRDLLEMDLIHKAKKLQMPILGICRGAQLACCLSGGSLYQDVDNHDHGLHAVSMDDGSVIETNTCHHQMMVLPPDSLLLGWTNALSPRRYKRDGYKMFATKEAEFVYFPLLHCLGIQGHPEWAPRTTDFVKKTFSLMKEYLHV